MRAELASIFYFFVLKSIILMKIQLTIHLGYRLRLKAELPTSCCSKQTSPELVTQEQQCLSGKKQCRVPWLQPEEANAKQTCSWKAEFPAVTTRLRGARSQSFNTNLCHTATARQPACPSASRLGGKGRRVWGGINMQIGGDDSAAHSN